MKFDKYTVTEEEFNLGVANFLKGCRTSDECLVHIACGGAIRQGFYDCYEVIDGNLDPGPTGFGLGPRKVPYCENCDPPDGVKHTYAVRLGIVMASKRSKQHA